jgi:hypothetical protein
MPIGNKDETARRIKSNIPHACIDRYLTRWKGSRIAPGKYTEPHGVLVVSHSERPTLSQHKARSAAGPGVAFPGAELLPLPSQTASDRRLPG